MVEVTGDVDVSKTVTYESKFSHFLFAFHRIFI